MTRPKQPPGGEVGTTVAIEPMSWQYDPEDEEESNEDTPGLFLGDLRSKESVVIEVEAEPETFESDEYGEGIRVPATFRGSDITHETEDGTEIEDGDRVNLVTWSKRLRRALTEYHVENDGIVGDTVDIKKVGSGMDVEYFVTEA